MCSLVRLEILPRLHPCSVLLVNLTWVGEVEDVPDPVVRKNPSEVGRWKCTIPFLCSGLNQSELASSKLSHGSQNSCLMIPFELTEEKEE